MKGSIMPALQVKDCPADIYEDLRLCADQEDRSITQQTIHILRLYLNDRRNIHVDKYSSRREFLAALKNRKPADFPDGCESAAEMIREDREDRIPPFDID